MVYLRMLLVYIHPVQATRVKIIGLVVDLTPITLPMVGLPASSTPTVTSATKVATTHCELSYPPAQCNPLAPVRRVVGWLANQLAALNRRHCTTSGLLGLRSQGIGFAAGLYLFSAATPIIPCVSPRQHLSYLL